MIFTSLAKKIFGSSNSRIIKSLQPLVIQINNQEEYFAKLTDDELKSQTILLKNKFNNDQNLDQILVEAFAVVKEAAKRVLKQRHFDVQLLGGIVLHRGMIAEMRTGEGKTLVATLAAYLNALSNKGVHVITVNDYLAKRDSKWMGKLYNFLGLTVGCITHESTDEERRLAYNCDITYGTNNEFGFDYLRDNMKFSTESLTQRAFNYAIVDELDAILIDEARTPLIISGPTEDNSALYYQVDKLIHKLNSQDFEKDEKTRSITLTEEGNNHVEELLKEQQLLTDKANLYDIENISLVHHINQALRAHQLFKLDIDYMVKDDKILIIDEFTGRVMDGRRYSEGLHQALEAKESVTIHNENQTLASVTFQNYFRLYPKLAGMTGTAMTEATEFREIYNLDVVTIPTNLSVKRTDLEDVIYRTNKEKYQAIVEEVKLRYQAKQPILVGTVSIEKSEYLSKLLKQQNIPHQILNAKYHEQEATIIAQAGRLGGVTIATNMAGRGTDIMLGGNISMLVNKNLSSSSTEYEQQALTTKFTQLVEEEKAQVLAAGGLFVLGTERHESRRIDNQLRGRSGRQGDPGSTKFFLSLEDDLMRIFASERIGNMLSKLGLKENEAIFHPMISRALEKAQQRVEGLNYEVRKNLLRFDDVMNEQRQVIYEQRKDIISSDDLTASLQLIYQELNNDIVDNYLQATTDDLDIDGIIKEFDHIYDIQLPFEQLELIIANKEQLLTLVNQQTKQLFVQKEEKYGQQTHELIIKRIFLITLDQLWKEHLHNLDHLRQGINLRAYAQRDPLNEYKREAFLMFELMLEHLRRQFVERVAHASINFDHLDDEVTPAPFINKFQETRIDPALINKQQLVNNSQKVGRNQDCPCGSKKKYKHCHGKLT